MIITMNMREFVTFYLESTTAEIIMDSIIIPISLTIKTSGTINNVYSQYGKELFPPVNDLSQARIVTEDTPSDDFDYTTTVKEGMYVLCGWMDSFSGLNARKILANMVNHSLKNPERRIILLFDDYEEREYNLMNFYREYIYSKYYYPCIIMVGGEMILTDRDKELLMDVFIQPSNSHIKKIKSAVKKEIEQCMDERKELWRISPSQRIGDCEYMSDRELYDMCKRIYGDDMKGKSHYSRNSLKLMLSDYYGTGVSDDEADLFIKQIKSGGIPIRF